MTISFVGDGATNTTRGSTLPMKPDGWIGHRLVRRKTLWADRFENESAASTNTARSLTVSTKQTDLFVHACEQQLAIASSDGAVSQAAFAGFVTKYCRDSGADALRGPACTAALFLFQDLPPSLQLSFVGFTTNNGCPSSDDPSQCLKMLNGDGGLFYVGADSISGLCASTFELMVDSNLLLLSSDEPSAQPTTTNAPITGPPFHVRESVAPSASPLSFAPQSQRGSGTDDRQMNTIVVALGITFTLCFMAAVAVKGMLWRRRQSKPVVMSEVDPALQGDVSVSSENSREFKPSGAPEEPPAYEASDQKSKQLDSSATSSTNSWFPKSSSSNTSVGSSGRETVGSVSSSRRNPGSGSHPGVAKDHFPYPQPLQQNDTTKKQFSRPRALVTENLSEANPVHIRKRFKHGKACSFSFDEDDCGDRGNSVMADDSKTVKSSLPHLRVDTGGPLVPSGAKPAELQCAQVNKENAKNCAIVKNARSTRGGVKASDRVAKFLDYHEARNRRRVLIDPEAPTLAVDNVCPDLQNQDVSS